MTGYVYIVDYGLDNECRPIVKIGLTQNPKSRLAQLNTSSPRRLEYFSVYQVADMAAVEREMHRMFADRRMNGEWFHLTPREADYQLKQFEYVPRPEPIEEVLQHNPLELVLEPVKRGRFVPRPKPIIRTKEVQVYQGARSTALAGTPGS